MSEQTTKERSASQLGKRYTELDHERRELEEKLKEVKDELSELDAELQSAMAEDGVDKMTINGLTLYVRREIRGGARDGDKRRMIQAFRDAGMEDMVASREEIPWKRLTSYLTELAENGQTDEFGLPSLPTQELEEAVDVYERRSIRTRKA